MKMCPRYATSSDSITSHVYTCTSVFHEPLHEVAKCVTYTYQYQLLYKHNVTTTKASLYICALYILVVIMLRCSFVRECS